MAKKALCVGINKFKNYPSSTLQGCVNDAKDMTGILKDFLGFKATDITTLTDAQATKVNIMKNLNEMVDGAKKGKYDYLVFSLSSHGTQVPDKDGDEPDNADEAFCPYDLAEKGDVWHPDHIITDDELHKLFTSLPKNVVLEVYFDTCHSGTGLKAIDFLLTRKPRFMPPPSLKAFKKLVGVEPRGLHNLLADKGLTHHILWAGCRANQTSADAKIGTSWHGAFTYYFVKNLRASKNKLARKDLLTKVKKDLKANDYDQVAQLECEATKRTVKLG
jgi:metacaspase-1